MEESVISTAGERFEELARIAPSSSFRSPDDFALLMSGECPEIDPWMWLLELKDLAEFWVDTLREQFVYLVLVPFAKDEFSDDIFCFAGNDDSGDPAVLVIHGFTTPGWEYRGMWRSFSEWYLDARQQHVQWLRDRGEESEALELPE